jgi:hypothetical protein
VQMFRLRLIGECRTIHREQALKSVTGIDLWREVSFFAARYGRDGEHVQVFDEGGEMVIRVGVATARSSLLATNAAA